MGSILDVKGQKFSEGPDGLKPGVVILHLVLEPDTGNIEIKRSERNPPPQNAHAAKVELDNWFTLLTNAVAMMIANLSTSLGIPKGLLIETMNRVVTTYLESGGTGGHRKRIVVNTGPQEKDNSVLVEEKTTAPKVKINYDNEVTERGFLSLGSETYVDYCGRVGASDRDKSRTPIASEFYNAIVFRKEICVINNSPVYLELGRDKAFTVTPDDEKNSKYLVAMVLGEADMQRKFYWQITAPEKTYELLSKIEEEAKKVATSIG